MTRHIRIPPALLNEQISDGAFRMALVLADYAGRDGDCWPSLRTLAGRQRCHYDTARRRLDELERSGLIRRTPRTKDGRMIPSLIRCLWVNSVGTDAGVGVGAVAGSTRAPVHRENQYQRTNPIKTKTN